MFVEAIERAASFTRPIHTITRIYGSDTLIRGAGTLFFVNADGWALTCAHVAHLLPTAENISKKYRNFKRELADNTGKIKKNKLLKMLEQKYDFNKKAAVEIKLNFMGCAVGNINLEARFHDKYDVALLKFNNYAKLLCNSFPVFPRDTMLKQGKYLCRLGFPFPEFTNFTYNKDKDCIEWTTSGRQTTPQYPIEGMVTRHVVDNSGVIMSFELSTPGLRGQSGGPAFDTDGKVWGMQSQTKHLDLDFDIDEQVMRRGVQKRVQDSAFLHVGRCIHVDVLKEFMRANSVQFNEEQY